MRSQRILTGVILAVVICGASVWSWAQVPAGAARSIAYTGRLELSGAPVSTPHDLRFVLLTAAAGSNDCVATATCPGQVFSDDVGNVTVSEGNFSVELGPVPEDTLLANDELYLAVAVREVGAGGDYAPLAGRQRLLGAPYAVTAAAARDYRMFGTAQVEHMEVEDADVSGSISFGSSTRQMLNLYGDVYGLGVQGSTLYQRTDENVAWFRDGTHSPTALNPGAGGAVLMDLNGNGDLHVRGDLTVEGGGGDIPGRVVGGARATCTTNGQTYRTCTAWGAGGCTMNGCGVTCSEGAVRLVMSAGLCFWSGSQAYDHRCDSILCVQ